SPTTDIYTLSLHDALPIYFSFPRASSPSVHLHITRPIYQGMGSNKFFVDRQPNTYAIAGGHAAIRIQYIGWFISQLIAKRIIGSKISLKIARIVDCAHVAD